MVLDFPFNHLVMFACATVIQIYGGLEFYKPSLMALKNRLADMNLLVSVGTLSAYFYSVVVLLFPDAVPTEARHLYFEASASVITFVLFGRFLEAKAKQRTTDFMKKLLNLKPKKATIVIDNKYHEVEAENIVKGDVVIIKPGETVPVDGVVLEGRSEVDKSSITGESKPEFVKEGDAVLSGSVNQLGVLKIKATKNARESIIYQIINLILQAQSKKPQIGRLADRITGYFVPFVLIISILTFDIWFFLTGSLEYSFVSMVAVLVIACPCALGLATPIAIVSTVGRAAKEGILIKNPEVIERFDRIDVAVFDKTGTLTYGKMKVVGHMIKDPDSLPLIKQLEAKVNHPVSKAIEEFLSGYRDVAEVSNVKVVPGEGVIGNINNIKVFAGNIKMLQNLGVETGDEEKKFFQQQIESGNSVVFCGVENRVVAVFSLEDTVRDEAFEVIKKLKSAKIKTIMLTGDNNTVAKQVAEQLDIDQYMSGLNPADKFSQIVRLKSEGKTLLFVGDGINDAPAMSASDVGIAVEGGTDIAKESGDIILMSKDLRTLTKSIELSKFGLKIIKQNLFWAYIYNIIGIPVAAGLLYPFFGVLLNPVYAGLAMSFSSVSVVLNSLRIKTKKL